MTKTKLVQGGGGRLLWQFHVTLKVAHKNLLNLSCCLFLDPKSPIISSGPKRPIKSDLHFANGIKYCKSLVQQLTP